MMNPINRHFQQNAISEANKKDADTDLQQAEDYLQIGLSLAAEINPARYLAMGGIVPSDTT